MMGIRKAHMRNENEGKREVGVFTDSLRNWSPLACTLTVSGTPRIDTITLG
jgi:hypothetical protein